MFTLDSEAAFQFATLAQDYAFGLITDSEFYDECQRILLDMMFRNGYTYEED